MYRSRLLPGLLTLELHKLSFKHIPIQPVQPTFIKFTLWLISSSTQNAYTNSCYITWGRPYNNLYLLSDDGSSWGSPSVIGSGSQLQNSSCIIYPASSVITDSGNNLTLSVPYNFKTAFIGAHYYWMDAQNSTDTANSTWQLKGSWQVVSSSVPVVSISTDKTSGVAGVVSPSLTWSATNSPTSCAASGDWSGTNKAVSGTNVPLGVLNTAKLYTYTMTCSNNNGTSSPASATVNVTASSSVTDSLQTNATKIFAGQSSDSDLVFYRRDLLFSVGRDTYA